MKILEVCDTCRTVHRTLEVDVPSWMEDGWLDGSGGYTRLCPKCRNGLVRRVPETSRNTDPQHELWSSLALMIMILLPLVIGVLILRLYPTWTLLALAFFILANIITIPATIKIFRRR